MTRIYDGNCLADWPTPDDALICPADSASRKLWGWQQDSRGKWYRDLRDGQKVSEPNNPAPVLADGGGRQSATTEKSV